MMNINLLNNLIKGVAEQIPLVHSFYTNSPYESWNIKEVKYGSVSFVVTKTITREQTTTYNAVLYYADRLTEDNSNRDSLHSDAATVIQTIVGALNQSDYYITVDYPVEITLFEQSFCDDLCGGYANVVITVEGMGECFNDEFSVPDIVATSAYYTKDEILELFPLRTQLAKVATTGSFNDLLDTPDLVTLPQHNQLIDDLNNIRTQLDGCVDEQEYNNLLAEQNRLQTELNDKVGSQQYNALIESVSEGLQTLAGDLNQKVSVGYFDNWADNVEKELDDKVGSQQYNQIIDDLNKVYVELLDKVGAQQYNQILNDLNNIRNQLDGCVDEQEYNNLLAEQNRLHTELSDKIGTQQYNQLINDINALKTALDSCVDEVEYNNIVNRIKTIETSLNDKISSQSFSQFVEGQNTINVNLAVELLNKVNTVYFDTVVDAINTELDNRVTTQSFDNLYEAIEINLVNLAKEVGDKVGDNEYQLFKSSVNNILNTKVDKQIFNNHVTNVNGILTRMRETINGKVDDTYFDEWKNGIEAEISERVTIQGFANYAANVYTKEEIENRLTNYGAYIEQYFNSQEFKDYLNAFVADFTEEFLKTALDYYTKSEMDEILSNLRLEDYYTKEEIATLLDGLELENYYKKSETYTKTEVDEAIANVEVDLSGYYTKTEVDKKIGDIDSILNNVLYVL